MTKTNWGSVIIDLALLTAAVYSGSYGLLFLCLFTGGYTHKELE